MNSKTKMQSSKDFQTYLASLAQAIKDRPIRRYPDARTVSERTTAIEACLDVGAWPMFASALTTAEIAYLSREIGIIKAKRTRTK